MAGLAVIGVALIVMAAVNLPTAGAVATVINALTGLVLLGLALWNGTASRGTTAGQPEAADRRQRLPIRVAYVALAFSALAIIIQVQPWWTISEDSGGIEAARTTPVVPGQSGVVAPVAASVRPPGRTCATVTSDSAGVYTNPDSSASPVKYKSGGDRIVLEPGQIPPPFDGWVKVWLPADAPGYGFMRADTLSAISCERPAGALR
ncbi:hypothetical protein [Plantactinospora sp. GCM10030261]|uniref:hypothetical protein n=1 Tax=Plantactinospora sp. GCM10030261 TaxID=3273420 RepID=UPI003622C48B